MRMLLRSVAMAVVVVVPALTTGVTPAEADTLLTPFGGTMFGRAATESDGAYGLSLGTMAGGTFGFELDVGRTGQVFGADGLFTDGALTTVMGNVLVGAPLGPLRPYATGGLGLIRASADGPDLANETQSDLGVDLGGGVMGFFGDHLGARIDVRYFRNVSGSDEHPVGLDVAGLDLGSFDSWRASVGASFRF